MHVFTHGEPAQKNTLPVHISICFFLKGSLSQSKEDILYALEP